MLNSTYYDLICRTFKAIANQLCLVLTIVFLLFPSTRVLAQEEEPNRGTVVGGKLSPMPIAIAPFSADGGTQVTVQLPIEISFSTKE